MKKLYGLLILLFFVKTLVAQDDKKESSTGFEGALRATPLFLWTKVEVDDAKRFTATNEGLKLGFAYGIMGNYFFAKNAGLSLELRHTLMGAKFSVKDTMGADTTKIYNLKLQYIELPLTLIMRTGEVGYMRFYGQFGLMPSINIKAKEDLTKEYGSTTHTDKNQDAPDIPVGMSLVIGGGVTYNLGGTTSLLGGVSFHNGFTNMVKVKEVNAKVKPAYIALNLGVIF